MPDLITSLKSLLKRKIGEFPCNIKKLQLKVELRSKRENLRGDKKKSVTSTPFALADIRHLAVAISRREQFLANVSELNLFFRLICLNFLK